MSKINPWKHVQVDKGKLKNNRYLNPTAPAPEPSPQPSPHSSELLQGRYILMDRADTKALGIHALREACKNASKSPHPKFVKPKGSAIYRPLTFKENIEARVNDYESNKDDDKRLRLFKRWIDSCTAVACKGKSTKFKIIPLSPDLVTIDKGFKKHFLSVDYDKLSGVELDRKDAVYGSWISRAQVVEHPAWLAAVEGDKHLLRTYANIVFTERKVEKQMAFFTRNKPDTDELRALFVNYLDGYSGAVGKYYLNYDGSFLRAAQPNTP